MVNPPLFSLAQTSYVDSIPSQKLSPFYPRNIPYRPQIVPMKLPFLPPKEEWLPSPGRRFAWQAPRPDIFNARRSVLMDMEYS